LAWRNGGASNWRNRGVIGGAFFTWWLVQGVNVGVIRA